MNCLLVESSDHFGEMPNVCRACKNTAVKTSLWSYKDQFEACTGLEISPTDGLPSMICDSCVAVLKIVYDFRTMCLTTDASWRQETETGTAETSECSSEADLVTDLLISEDVGCSFIECETLEQEEEVVEVNPLSPVSRVSFEQDADVTVLSDGEETIYETLVSCDDVANHEQHDQNVAQHDTNEESSDRCSPLLVVVPLKVSPTKTASESEPKQRFPCLDCGKSFCNKPNLYRHLISHNGQKPFRCDICGSGFTQSGSLKQHKLIHEGIKNYTCSVCNDSFTQGKSLKLHMHRHTGAKPYPCQHCPARFRQKGCLMRHLQVHV
ncbi:zinc finger protein 70-like [Anopheles bellator]|uniref:zinc finger protein 70-like n=1 Tax=Anopheles bellator TaxID=139047 RepID=UPI002648A201|nr:zinc finger protein 70-like [Anopheles bellator]